jgi:4-amino-4-deoxychorismate lyase
MSIKALVNSEVSSSVTVDDRGLIYGDGLFETIKVVAGKPEFVDLHLNRLKLAAARLSINYDALALKDDVATLLHDADHGVLKIILTRGQSGRGYKADASVEANRILSLGIASQDYSAQQSKGVHVKVCDTRLGINPQLAGLKHLSRIENVLARSEWDDPAIAEGLMLDTFGNVVEGTMSNVFFVKDNMLFTPDIHRCGVAGIIRQLIVDKLASSIDIECVVQDLSLNDFLHAQEIFICNSLIGVVPVKAIGCHRKSVGSVTKIIQSALAAEVARNNV